LAESAQKEGDPDLNDAMARIVDSIQGMIKQLRAFSEAAAVEKERRAPPKGPPQRAKSQMTMTLDAESKVNDARKQLQQAEMQLKKLRQQTAAQARPPPGKT
jgi:hypothetical protein